MRGKPKVNYRMVDHFMEHMSSEFEMSLVGELTYFLGLQVKQIGNGTFISQTQIFQEPGKEVWLIINHSSSHTYRDSYKNISRQKRQERRSNTVQKHDWQFTLSHSKQTRFML